MQVVLRIRVEPYDGSAPHESLAFQAHAQEDANYYVGREQGDWLIDSAFLSSPHARFYWSQGRWWVEDMQSINGTYLRLRQPQRVPAGTWFRIGTQTWQIVSAPPWSVPAPEADGTQPWYVQPTPLYFQLIQHIGVSQTGTIFHSPRTQLRIGATAGDLCFPHDPLLSSPHLSIDAQKEAGFALEDLQSRKGSYVALTTPYALQPADVLLLGQHLLHVELESDMMFV